MLTHKDMLRPQGRKHTGRVEAVLAHLRRENPRTHLVVLGIIPRGWTDAAHVYSWPSMYAAGIGAVNAALDAWSAQDQAATYLDCGAVLLPGGKVSLSGGVRALLMHVLKSPFMLLATQNTHVCIMSLFEQDMQHTTMIYWAQTERSFGSTFGCTCDPDVGRAKGRTAQCTRFSVTVPAFTYGPHAMFITSPRTRCLICRVARADRAGAHAGCAAPQCGGHGAVCQVHRAGAR